jgi:hypothetical protein
MHLRSLIPFAAVLALAACGEEQTAEAPATPAAPTAVETAETPASPGASTATAPAPSTTAGTDAADNAVETTGTATTAPPTGSTQTAATSATSLDSFQGRTYSAGPVSLQLNPDNTFVMNEVEGNQKVEGRYSYENGMLTFSEPAGDVGTAKFPMRCRFETSGASDFRLGDTDGACTRFKDLTFKPAAG